MSTYREQLAKSLVGKKEELIKKAITHQMGGEDWIIADIIGRGEFKQYHDGKTVFEFDGEEMIIFMPPEFQSKNTEFSMATDATFKYKELYL